MMKLEYPQEIEVWYVIPAIKRELAISMINDYGLNQKQIAERLGLTEAAVSQYLHSRRASEVEFNQEFKDKIKIAAKNIIDDKNKGSIIREVMNVCNDYRNSKLICELHKKVGMVYKDECEVCFGGRI